MKWLKGSCEFFVWSWRNLTGLCVGLTAVSLLLVGFAIAWPYMLASAHEDGEKWCQERYGAFGATKYFGHGQCIVEINGRFYPAETFRIDAKLRG